MNPSMLTVGDRMTPAPFIVAPEDKLGRARRLMEEHGIRHLPVMRGDNLVGVVSDRDLNLVQTFAHAPPDIITVEDAMTPDPYVVPPSAPLHHVARAMADRKCGSAIVMEHGAVVGVFTTIDALRAFADVLEGQDRRRRSEPRAA